MFRMSHDAVDFFSADFTAAGVIVAGEEYPLGYFAAEALEVSGQLTLDIGAAAKEFAAEAQMFFAARDPSSAGIANEAFRRLWHLLRKLPLYDLLLRQVLPCWPRVGRSQYWVLYPPTATNQRPQFLHLRGRFPAAIPLVKSK